MTTNLKCFLCLIPCGPPEPAEDCENLKEKIDLLINYVAVAATRMANSSSSSFSFCKQCTALVESFSASHEELELARRKVDSCVEKICDVMLDGNNQREKDKDMGNESMRKDILGKSCLKITKSQPGATEKAKRVRFVIGDDDTPSRVEVPPPRSSPTAPSSSSSLEKIKIEPSRKLPDFIWEKGTAIRYRKEVTAKDFPFHQSHSSGFETGVLQKIKKEVSEETAQKRWPSLLWETLPHYIIRKSCIKIDDHVETLYYCNRCNRRFFMLHLHLKIHGIIRPGSSQNQYENLGGGHDVSMEVDAPGTKISALDESGTNAIVTVTTAPENQKRSETVTPLAVHQEQEDVETPSTSSRCTSSKQQRLESMMEIDLGDIKLEQEELVWSYDNQNQSNEKGSKPNETGLTSGVVPQPIQDDDEIIKMGTKKAKDGKSTSYIYLCKKCNVTFATSPALHRRKKRHQEPGPSPTPAATATATPEGSNRRISQPKSSESDKLKVLQTKKTPTELPNFITRKGTMYKFNQKQTLYYCSQCSMEFPSSNLTNHKRKHGIGKLECGNCDRTFYTKQNLVKHMKKGQCNKKKGSA